MLNNLINILIISSLAMIGADRINILSESFDFFIFTPYLFFSFLAVFILTVYKKDSLDFSWIFSNNFILLFFSIYLISCIISIFFSIDIYMSIKRFLLLSYLILSSSIILSYSSDINKLKRILIISSFAGSILFYFFNLILLINWFSNIEITSIFINFVPDQIAYFIPRLGGYSMDSNRGNVVLFFFTFILFIFNSETKYTKTLIIINICLLFLSFSRTLYLLSFMVILLQLFISEKEQRNNMLIFSLYGIVFFIITIYFMNINEYIDLSLALEERLNIFEVSRFSSAGIHFKLIKEGFHTAFSDLKILLFGSGFGTSYLLIKGYYWSGIKYGNYHSLYITSLVECGFINLISILVISFILPLFMNYKNHIFTFLFGLLFFNIFYQLIMEPLFWFSILLFYKFSFLEQLNEK